GAGAPAGAGAGDAVGDGAGLARPGRGGARGEAGVAARDGQGVRVRLRDGAADAHPPGAPGGGAIPLLVVAPPRAAGRLVRPDPVRGGAVVLPGADRGPSAAAGAGGAVRAVHR